MQRSPCRQNGAILVMTTLFIVVLLGFSALAIDLGRLYVLRTEMQNAADAAALAAAAELDGGTNAISDAVIAARNLLQHQGRFASNQELLSILKYNEPAPLDDADLNALNAFEFYSWINEENDIKPDICTRPLLPGSSTGYDNDKCLATSDADAHYVKIKLHPDLVIDQKEYFQISLYLVPVLGIFHEDGPMMKTASTAVSAVAGAGANNLCNYPPMFMCANEEGENYPGLETGQQVRLKEPNAGDPWGPGNVGFLKPYGDVILYEDDDYDTKENPIHLSGDKALAAALANEKNNPCSPAIVSTKTGVNTNMTRWGFNTRFGMYEDLDEFKKTNPPAPNVVDYPRDDTFFEGTSGYDPDDHIGDGWLDSAGKLTECLSTGTTTPSNPHCNGATRPETFNDVDYFAYYQGGTTPPSSSMSRHDVYEWELSNALPVLNSTHVDIDPLDSTNKYQQTNCFDDKKPGKDNCLTHNGDPTVNDDANPTPPTPYPVIGDADRRVLFVAVIKCEEYEIQGSSPDIDLLKYGSFHKFFLTQHAQPAPHAEFFAEYLGEVTDKELAQQILIHRAIQLYE